MAESGLLINIKLIKTMKELSIFILLILSLLITACREDDFSAKADLWQVDKVETITGDNQASVTWTPSDKRKANEYLVTWTAGTAGIEGGSKMVDGGITTLLIEHLQNDITYTIAVQARYADGLSGKVETTVTPKSTRFDVTGLKAVPGSEKVRLQWTKPLSDKLKSYTITVNPGGKTVEINTPDTEKQLIEGLTNGTEYTFTVTANYANGSSAGVTTKATPGVVSAVTTEAATLTVNQSVKFTANDMYFTKGDIQAVSWTFGDGTTSQDLTPTHSYAKSGTYKVMVHVTYTNGTTEDGSSEITVNDFTWSRFNLTNGSAYGYVKVSSVVFSPDGTTAYIPTSSPNGHLFAFGVWTGKLNWMYAVSTATYGGGSVVDKDGNIYQCGTDKKVYALTKDGAEKWVLDVDGIIGAFPAVTTDGTLYCLTNGCTLYAINTAEGKVRWSHKLSGSTGSAVAVDASGNVYAGTYTGIYAFKSDGTTLWTASNLAITERGSFAIANGTLYAALRSKAGIVAIDMATGKTKWKYTTSGGDCYLPVTDKDGTVYFTEKGSQTVFAVTSNGQLKWKKDVGCNLVYTGIAIAENGNVYFGTQGKASDGNYKVFGLSGSNGSVVFEQDCDQQIMSAATIGPDKRLYIGTIGSSAAVPGRIITFNINSHAASGWSVRGGNLQGTNSLR